MSQQPDPFHPAQQPPAPGDAPSPFESPRPYAGQPDVGQPYAGQPYTGQSPFAAPAQPSPVDPPTAAGAPPVAPAPAAPFGYPAAPPPPPGGGYPAYGQAPTAPYPSYQPYASAPRPDLASWGERVVAHLLDQLLMLPGWILYIVGFVVLIASSGTKNSRGVTVGGSSSGIATGMLMLALSGLVFLGVGIWNVVIRQGRTGQSWGKSKRGLYVVGQETGALIGMGNNFLRQLAHVVDGAIYIGYLWPLWDAHKQTLADKIVKTVVIKAPR